MPADLVVEELTRDVWSTFLGLEALERTTPATLDEGLVASVDISGGWEGTVSISMPLGLAAHLASRMLACPVEDLSPVEVRDVLGELAHVLGGNVKGAVPGPCALSMPRVETGADRAPAMTRRFWFECDGQPFSVTVVKRPHGSES